MNRRLFLLGYLPLLVTGYVFTSSVSGFLLTGFGLVFLFDKYHFRLFAWPALAWRREIAIRGGSFLGGVATSYLLRPSYVPVREAVYRGFMFCLAVLVVERFCGGKGRLRWVVLVVLVALLIPWQVALHPLHIVPKRTPAASGLLVEDVRFSSRDGTLLAAWLMPHPSARGNVIYCHGLGRNRGQGAGLFKTLHGLGLNILAFDFRGHGDSAGHTSTFGDREVEDLKAAAHYVRERFPNQPLFLVGTSLGAAVILQALSEIPNVCGVWSEAAFSRLSSTVENQFAWLPGPLRWVVVEGYYVLGWLDCGFWAPALNPVSRLDGLTVPICFVHGRRDELVPFAQGQELYGAYGGPKRNWWIQEATHYNVRQCDSEEYKRRLKRFVEDCLCGAVR